MATRHRNSLPLYTLLGVIALASMLLQKIIMQLLDSAGFISASKVEVRIDPRVHPMPDVIASRNKLAPEPYPKKATDVVVEIISGNDGYVVIREKCRSYQAWGFGHIYLVVPDDQQFWSGETAHLFL